MTDRQTILHYEQENEQVYTETMTTGYRKYDAEFIHTKAYQHFSSLIKETLKTLPTPVSVLDVGCGTGRYFHVLTNIASLTGIDVSENMLKEAANPYKREDVPVDEIKLIHSNFYFHDFGNEKFDFIYSIGVLGEHAIFDAHTRDKLFYLLNKGGKLVFSVVDLEPRKNWKRKLAETLYPLLPKSLKSALDKRWKICYMTWAQLDEMMKAGQFSHYEIKRYASEDPKWEGVHLECIATK